MNSDPGTLDGVNEAKGSSFDAVELHQAIYAELRKLAAAKMRNERQDHTLQPTALVHEAFLQLSGPEGNIWENRAHFFGAASEAMRQILIKSALRRRRLKRGGGAEKAEFHESQIVAPIEDDRLLQIHEVLDELAKEDALRASIVKLKFFVGMTNDEIAVSLDLNEKTIRRHWAVAKLRLFELITEGSDGETGSPSDPDLSPS
jgi:RNA polymerase sigma factor (TIGR02999 family)